MKKIALLLLLSLTGLNCATTSNRTKTILTMVGTGLIVGTIAASRAPVDENPGTVGMLYGGTSAATAALISLYVFDEQHRADIFEKQLNASQKEVDALRGESDTGNHQDIVETGVGLERQLPKEYQGLVRPGKWSIYRVDTWVAQGESTLVHQDKMVRITPPQFKPPKFIAEQSALQQGAHENESPNKFGDISQTTTKGEK